MEYTQIFCLCDILSLYSWRQEDGCWSAVGLLVHVACVCEPACVNIQYWPVSLMPSSSPLRSHPAAISKQMSVVFKQGTSWRIRPKRTLITTVTTPVWTGYDLKTPTRIQTPSTSLPSGLHFSRTEVWGLSHVWFSSWRNTWLSRAKAGFMPLTYGSIIHTSLVVNSVNRFIACMFRPLAPPARMVSSHVNAGNFECTQSSTCVSLPHLAKIPGRFHISIFVTTMHKSESHNVCHYILNRVCHSSPCWVPRSWKKDSGLRASLFTVQKDFIFNASSFAIPFHSILVQQFGSTAF